MGGRGKAPHHRGPHQVTARRIKQAADADLTTRCWRCQRTMPEIRRTKPHAQWQAGHLTDGQVGGPYAPECSPCNAAAGARITNNKKQPPRTDLTW